MLELEGLESVLTRPSAAWRHAVVERPEIDPGSGLDSPLSEATL